MKKTTTRLASIAALLIMTAFAIILAQHDARKRDRQAEPLALASVSPEPTDPIAGDLVWPGKPPVVRGNNGKLPSSPVGSTDDSMESTHSDLGRLEVPNSLRGESFRSEPDSYTEPVSIANYPVENFPGNFPGDSGNFPGGGNFPGDRALSPTAEPSAGDRALSPSANFPGDRAQFHEPSAGDRAFRNDEGRNDEGDSESRYPAGNLVADRNAGAGWSEPGRTDTRHTLDSNVVVASGQQPALPTWLPDGSSPPSVPTSSLPAPTPVATLSDPQPPIGTSFPDQSPPTSWDGVSSGSPFPPMQSTNLPASPSGPNGPGLQGGPSVSGFANAGSSASGPMQTLGNGNSEFSAGTPSNPGLFPTQQTDSNLTTSAPRPLDPNNNRHSSASVLSASSNQARLPESGTRTALVSNQPGSRFLDGSQNPVMQIHKRAPEEIQVGKKATFVITVRNAGNATAHDVIVIDRVPKGARFVESSPSLTPTSEGLLTWMLGEMSAGDERTISLQIIPEVEGEVGSVASVHFAAQASVRTVATLPQLVLQADSIGPVIIGQSQQVVVSIQNTGSGVARGVRLEADIPAELRHESGETQLEAYVGDLRPSESRRLTLGVAAVQPGQSQCVLRAVNDDGVHTERAIAIDVRAPQLAATISGPNLRYLERQASYQVVVTNSGTALARNLDFMVHLPVGLKFVSVDIPQATYNPQTHSVSLGLAELDSGQSAPFSLTVLPVQLGPQAIRFNATGDLGISTEAKTQMTVAGLAELSFTIGQDNGTVEVGASTTYAVQVTNVGNQPDKNVQMIVQLPEGTQLLQVDAPVEYRLEAGKIVFAPVAEMRNRDVKTFRFQVQHQRAGNQVVRSQLTSENWPVAVVKEEGTLVYNDRN